MERCVMCGRDLATSAGTYTGTYGALCDRCHQLNASGTLDCMASAVLDDMEFALEELETVRDVRRCILTVLESPWLREKFDKRYG